MSNLSERLNGNPLLREAIVPVVLFVVGKMMESAANGMEGGELDTISIGFLGIFIMQLSGYMACRGLANVLSDQPAGFIAEAAGNLVALPILFRCALFFAIFTSGITLREANVLRDAYWSHVLILFMMITLVPTLIAAHKRGLLGLLDEPGVKSAQRVAHVDAKRETQINTGGIGDLDAFLSGGKQREVQARQVQPGDDEIYEDEDEFVLPQYTSGVDAVRGGK